MLLTTVISFASMFREFTNLSALFMGGRMTFYMVDMIRILAIACLILSILSIVYMAFLKKLKKWLPIAVSIVIAVMLILSIFSGRPHLIVIYSILLIGLILLAKLNWKLKAILAIVVIFVGLLFSSGYMQNNQQQESREPQTSGAVGLEYKSCDPEDFTKQDAYYFPIFAKDDSPEYCRPRSDRLCHSDMCYTKYFRYATWRKNPQLCEKLNQSIEEFWKNKCFYEVSFFQFDRNICNKLSNDQHKAGCLMQAENTEGVNGLDRALYYAKNWFKVCSDDPTLSYRHDLERPPPPTKKEVAECEIRILDYLKNNYEKRCNDKFCDYFRVFDKDNISSCEIVEDYKNSCLNTFYGLREN